MGCIHTDLRQLYRIKKCGLAHTYDKSGSGVIILEENFVQIDLIIAELLPFVKCDLDLHFQGQLI